MIGPSKSLIMCRGILLCPDMSKFLIESINLFWQSFCIKVFIEVPNFL